MKRIVMFSGGVGSWATARRVSDTYGTDGLALLFADTLMEDEDLYRFLDQAAANVGGELIKVADGRDPWQVFFDERFLGNSRIDPCSKILKRELLRRWLEEHCDPADTVVYIGIDWTEEHRYIKAQKYWSPWTCEAPLCAPPLMDKKHQLEALRAAGIEAPRLYKLGFPHNNCGGFCIKAGEGAFALLLKTMPDRFAYHERREQELRAYLGKDVAILKWRSGPKKGQPMPLTELRAKVASKQADLFDLGGCACFLPGEDAAA